MKENKTNQVNESVFLGQLAGLQDPSGLHHLVLVGSQMRDGHSGEFDRLTIFEE